MTPCRAQHKDDRDFNQGELQCEEQTDTDHKERGNVTWTEWLTVTRRSNSLYIQGAVKNVTTTNHCSLLKMTMFQYTIFDGYLQGSSTFLVQFYTIIFYENQKWQEVQEGPKRPS